MKKNLSIASIVFSALGMVTLVAGCIQVAVSYSLMINSKSPHADAELVFIFLYAYVLIALVFFIVAFVLLCIVFVKAKKDKTLSNKKK